MSQALHRWSLPYAAHLGVRQKDDALFQHSAASADPLDQIRHAASLGLAGIEDNGAPQRSAEQQTRIGQELARLGLRMGCFVCHVGSPPFWGHRDAGTREQLRQLIQSAIDTARRMGGRQLVVVSARDADLPLEQDLAGMADNLRDMLPLARDAGVTICLEHVCPQRVPGLLMSSLSHSLQLVRQLADPSLKLVFDTYHTQSTEGGNLVDHYQRVRDAVGAVQIADFPGRAEPGTGQADIAGLLRCLRTEGHSGLIELEFMPSKPGLEGEQQVLRALKLLDASLSSTPAEP